MNAAVPTSLWSAFLGLYGGYVTNLDFERPDDSGVPGIAGRGSVSHTHRGPRNELSFSMQGGGVYYREHTDANAADGSVQLATSHKFSRRANLKFDANAAYVTTDLSRILVDTGLQLERSQTQNYGGGVGFDLTTGKRTTLGLNARYDRVDFDDPQLIDTESGTAGVSLSRRYSSRSSLSLLYNFIRTNAIRYGYDSHQASLGWSRALTRRLTFSLASGAGYALEPPLDDRRADRLYYYGTAGLSGQVRRSTVNLQLRRSINPAYGLGGNLLSYGAALSAGIPVGRHINLAMGGVHTWSEDPAGLRSSAFVSDDANASFSLTFRRRLGLSLGYLFRRYDPQNRPAITSHRGQFGLTWTYARP